MSRDLNESHRHAVEMVRFYFAAYRTARQTRYWPEVYLYRSYVTAWIERCRLYRWQLGSAA